jgi:hypothetical protein
MTTHTRIVRGSLADCPSPNYREGWWWHVYAQASPIREFGYDPEGPFISKAHAIRHYRFTQRAARQMWITGYWPKEPPNIGWCQHPGRTLMRPTLNPIRNRNFFGAKKRAWMRENGR